jgi:hypothetical protein
LKRKQNVDNVKGTIAFINIVDVHVETTRSKAMKYKCLRNEIEKIIKM